MLRRMSLRAVAAIAPTGGVSMPALADPVTIRVVSKDLLNSFWIHKFIAGEAKIDQWDRFISEWSAACGAHKSQCARTVLNDK